MFRETVLNNFIQPARLMAIALILLVFGLLTIIGRMLFFYPAQFSPLSLQVSRCVLPQNRLMRFDLFGAAADSSPTGITSLPLTLTGLLVSSDARFTLAVILLEGKQGSYGEGDALPLPGVSVHKISREGVILKQPDGLRLLNYSGQAEQQSPPKAGLLNRFISDPQRIFDYLSITPVLDENNKLRGYRINPGPKPELFMQSGLQPGDLAVAIDGSDLRDSLQAQQIVQQLPKLTAFTVSVEREGQRHDILISPGEGTP